MYVCIYIYIRWINVLNKNLHQYKNHWKNYPELLGLHSIKFMETLLYFQLIRQQTITKELGLSNNNETCTYEELSF